MNNENNIANYDFGHANGQNAAIPCPQCGHNIPVTLETLLGNTRFMCLKCRLVLNMDRNRSRESLSQIQKFKKNQDKIMKETKSI